MNGQYGNDVVHLDNFAGSATRNDYETWDSALIFAYYFFGCLALFDRCISDGTKVN